MLSIECYSNDRKPKLNPKRIDCFESEICNILKFKVLIEMKIIK